MSQIKITAPVRVWKKNTGNWTWEKFTDHGRADVIFRRLQRLENPDPPAFDGHSYLERFMSVRNAEEAFRFVNRFGSPAAEIVKWGEIRFSEFVALQQIVQSAVATPLSAWPPKDVPIGLYSEHLSLRWSTSPPTFVHETDMGIAACCAQVFFEKLSGVEFRWCANSDCTGIFRKTTGHDKIYCCYDCGHKMAVQADRARAKARKTKVRKKKDRKGK